MDKIRIIVNKEEFKRRQARGIAAAKARGVKFGAPPKTKPDEYDIVKKLYSKKKINSRKAAHMLNVSQSTFLKWIREK